MLEIGAEAETGHLHAVRVGLDDLAVDLAPHDGAGVSGGDDESVPLVEALRQTGDRALMAEALERPAAHDAPERALALEGAREEGEIVMQGDPQNDVIRLERLKLLAGRGVPKDGGPILRAGESPSPLRVEGDGANVVRMADEVEQFLAGDGVPEDGIVIGGGQ